MKFIAFLLMTMTVISCQSQPSTVSLSPADFQEKITSTKNAVVLDVRTPGEFEEGAIANAVNLDFRDEHFESKAQLLDANKTYFVYCLSGGRSSSAAELMRKNGFKNVFELNGGILAWKKNNLTLSAGKNPVSSDKISAADYEALIKSDKVVLIDFNAPWCGPCRQMLPMLEALTKEYQGKATIIRINIDENKELTRRLNIDEIPFFKLYRNGKEIGNYIGQMDRASLVKLLDGK